MIWNCHAFYMYFLVLCDVGRLTGQRIAIITIPLSHGVFRFQKFKHIKKMYGKLMLQNGQRFFLFFSVVRKCLVLFHMVEEFNCRYLGCHIARIKDGIFSPYRKNNKIILLKCSGKVIS